MQEVDVAYQVNDRRHFFKVVGDRIVGAPHVMLEHDVDLTAGTSWEQEGYIVAPFLEPTLNDRLRDGLTEFVFEQMRAVGAPPPAGFKIEDYHKLVDADRHAALIERTRHCMPIELFPIPLEPVTERISEICARRVTIHNPATDKSLFCVRIVRPQSGDNNPPHRDVWIDRLRHGINIYFPVAGSNSRSSLPLIPRSHRWPESEIERTAAGALINGLQFSVPAVTGSKHGLQMICPNPGPAEVLVFSPYLIHGGGRNAQDDTTRVSLEMRFFAA